MVLSDVTSHNKAAALGAVAIVTTPKSKPTIVTAAIRIDSFLAAGWMVIVFMSDPFLPHYRGSGVAVSEEERDDGHDHGNHGLPPREGGPKAGSGVGEPREKHEGEHREEERKDGRSHSHGKVGHRCHPRVGERRVALVVERLHELAVLGPAEVRLDVADTLVESGLVVVAEDGDVERLDRVGVVLLEPRRLRCVGHRSGRRGGRGRGRVGRRVHVAGVVRRRRLDGSLRDRRASRSRRGGVEVQRLGRDPGVVLLDDRDELAVRRHRCGLPLVSLDDVQPQLGEVVLQLLRSRLRVVVHRVHGRTVLVPGVLGVERGVERGLLELERAVLVEDRNPVSGHGGKLSVHEPLKARGMGCGARVHTHASG